MTPWQISFVAMSLALGEPLEHALASLGPDRLGALEPFLGEMRGPTRAGRARALASALAAIALDIERGRLA